MICSTPDLSKSGVAIFPDQPISVDCSFRMDGVKRLREFASTHARLSRFTYYVDPEFEQFDDGLRVFYLDAVMLTIRVHVLFLFSIKHFDDVMVISRLMVISRFNIYM